jgi:ZIP family zinc transporter
LAFVVSNEVIPETHGGKFARVATFGVMVEFVVMMFLDTALG